MFETQMESSATHLCPQNKKQKDHRGFEKHQEVNKISANLKAKSHAAQSFKRGSENQDPNEAAKSIKGPNKPKSISRLPVLAKSLQPILTDISQSTGHKRWEEKPLLGKAQKRKTCTKPVPFSLSQSRTHSQKSTEATFERSRSGMPLTRPPRYTPSKTLSITEQRPKNRTPTLNTALGNTSVDHTSNTKKIPLSRESYTDAKSKPKCRNSVTQVVNDSSSVISSSIQCDLSTQLGSITLTHSELTKDQSHSFSSGEAEDQAVCQPKTKSCIQTLLSANCATGRVVSFSPDPSALHSILLNEGVKVAGPVGATPQASACPSGRGTSIYSARRVPVKKPQTETTGAEPGPTGNALPFSPDPSALQNILHNEGVKVGGHVGATPRVSTCPSGRETAIYSARRVPVKKTKTEAATAVPGRTGNAVHFSPDPSALRSILLNEGIKASGLVEATPRVSAYPSGRGTSIYSAQRVPVKKAREEGTAIEAAHAGASRTPASKWSQKQVPYSHSQSLRRLISAPKTPLFNASPGRIEAQVSSTDSSTQQEENVVQRLFQEEPAQEIKEARNKATSGSLLENQQSTPAVQPFIQAPNRQSVIVLASGQRLFGPAPSQDGAQNPELQISEHAGQLQPCATSTEAQSVAAVQSVHSGSQSAQTSDKSKRMTPSALCKTKAPNLSLAVCTLRRRLPPLEEMFLDEECATYTTCHQLWPAQPRCSNPVASILLFQDSTCFVPIGLTSPSLSPVRHLSSPIRA